MYHRHPTSLYRYIFNKSRPTDREPGNFPPTFFPNWCTGTTWLPEDLESCISRLDKVSSQVSAPPDSDFHRFEKLKGTWNLELGTLRTSSNFPRHCPNLSCQFSTSTSIPLSPAGARCSPLQPVRHPHYAHYSHYSHYSTAAPLAKRYPVPVPPDPPPCLPVFQLCFLEQHQGQKNSPLPIHTPTSGPPS